MKSFLKLSLLSSFGLLLVGCGHHTHTDVPGPNDLSVITKGQPVPTIEDLQVIAKGQVPTASDLQVVAKGVAEVVVPEEAVAVEEPVVEVLAPDYGPILGKAISGYDPVSYFDGGPVLGQSDLHVTHDGATYYFASEGSRDRFYADPVAYAPAYGGWCAYAIAKTGDLVEVNPNTYKIVDGRLHLFYNKHLINTLKLWNRNETEFNVQAKANWQNLVSKGKARVNTDQ